MSNKDRTGIEKVIRHPVTWTTGAIASLYTVGSFAIFDPVSVTVAFLEVIAANSSTLFTGFSIAGFTVLPRLSVPPVIPKVVSGAAIFLGLVVVAQILSKVWDKFEEKLR